MILGVLVHVPDVEQLLAGDDVSRGQHRRHHGMVLIVVLVHAVAAHQMQAWVVSLDLGADRLHVSGILIVVDRIGLRLADDMAVDHVAGLHQPQ